jgi:hypothetical protein
MQGIAGIDLGDLATGAYIVRMRNRKSTDNLFSVWLRHMETDLGRRIMLNEAGS